MLSFVELHWFCNILIDIDRADNQMVHDGWALTMYSEDHPWIQLSFSLHIHIYLYIQETPNLYAFCVSKIYFKSWLFRTSNVGLQT